MFGKGKKVPLIERFEQLQSELDVEIRGLDAQIDVADVAVEGALCEVRALAELAKRLAEKWQ